MKAIVIAGTSSGVGKTTIAVGLMAALRHRGLRVQPFKVGPDYIDPSFHTWATGEPSRNLDTWMLSRAAVAELFTRAMSGKDIAVVEGVMGLFDGHSAAGEEGSTAEVAKVLGAPVLLIVDSSKAGRSLAATVAGFKSFDRSLSIGGVILNGVATPGHLALCSQAVEESAGVRVLGHLRQSPHLIQPERHLGLVPTGEVSPGDEFLDRLTEQIETNFDLPGILSLSEKALPPPVIPALFPNSPRRPVAKIAIARDKAFTFYYQDSLDLLQAWGAELLPFSPLDDAGLPAGISGMYIGGGFPELHAAALASNRPMLEAVRTAASAGLPIYAECGGLMYLGKGIRDQQGTVHEMTGVAPFASRIDGAKLTLGYRTVRALQDGPLLRKGESVRGHEFHWSRLEPGHPKTNAYSLDDEARREGFQLGNVFASYVHLHLGAKNGLAPRFVEVCRAFVTSL